MQKIAVIGLGRFGGALAENLALEGAEVIAIDARPELIGAIKDKVALAVSADASDVETLRSLGVGKADVVIVAIGENFEACQLAMLAARDLEYPRVIARANDRVLATAVVRVTDGRFEARDVSVGRNENGRALILEGLKPGEKVVTRGALLLDSQAEQLL